MIVTTQKDAVRFPKDRPPRPADLLHAGGDQDPARREGLSGLRPQNLFPLTWKRCSIYVARALIAPIQALPLTWVARLGRVGRRRSLIGSTPGTGAWRCETCDVASARKRSPEEIRALARENFRRIGENFACAAQDGRP